MKIEKEVSKNYDILAESYHEMRTKKYPQGWFYNEMLEMPATLELLGNVKGKKILDFGCGTGIYAKILTKKRAKVKGFDISREMIKIAKQENPNLDLRVSSGNKIPFDEKFDIVLASLVVHYIKDWNRMFKQIKRVLKKNGIFVFSTGNPVVETTEKIKIKGRKVRVLGDYFTERKYYANWKPHDRKIIVKMPAYHLRYETIIKKIIRNGFEIIDYKDAFPIRKAKKLFPEDYEFCSKIPFFTVWKVKLK